jgi:hypothetical protein
MPLCSICDNLDLSKLTDAENDLQDIPHHKSLANLKQSALSCALCKLFFKGSSVIPGIRWPDTSDLEDSPVTLRGRQYLDDKDNQRGIYALKVRCDTARVHALFGLYTDEGWRCTLFTSFGHDF